MKSVIFAATSLAFAFSVSTASAQDLAPVNLKALGAFSNLNVSKSVEKPFWTQTIPNESKGKITVDFTTLDQMGLQGTEVLRLIRLGVVDFASGNVSYMSADSPMFDALDLPGVYPDLATFKKAADAYRPILEKIMAERYNAKLLVIWPNPPQVLYCKPAITGSADLKGKKVRSFSPTIADFITGLGATPVQITFPEVVPALQSGAIDCGVTGTLSGNSAKWWEVTDYFFPLVISWSPWFHAVNLNTWNRLPAATRTFLEQEFKKAEARFWESAAQEGDQGIDCNIGKPDCKLGVSAHMKLVPVTDKDKANLKTIAETIILKKWSARCGADCSATWQKTVGDAIGLKLN